MARRIACFVLALFGLTALAVAQQETLLIAGFETEAELLRWEKLRCFRRRLLPNAP